MPYPVASPAVLALLSTSEYLYELFGRFHYLAPFTVLLLCGIGFPLPEEVTLIGSGVLLHQGKVEFVPITLVCSAAILLGDSIPYFLGRRFGPSALRSRWLAKILHPERFARFQKRYDEHHNWAIFTCRFLPGLRIPGYFLAGTMGMSFTRFILLDIAGVLISVPISIWFGKLFGDSMEDLRKSVKDLHLILSFGVVAVVITILVRARIRRRDAARLQTPPADETTD